MTSKLPAKKMRKKSSPNARVPKDLGIPREEEPQRVALARGGMIATAHHLASRAGKEVFEAGGNAFDAAVAAAFTLGVVEPAASGLGGQTMALFHDAESKKTMALDGSSRAPNRTSLATISKREKLKGYKASTVPSTPAVLDYMRRRYGKLKLSTLLAPAIRWAEQGYRVSRLQHALTVREQKSLKAQTGGKVFLKRNGKPYGVGEVFRQPALAATLRRIAKHGIKDFYRGEIARAIDADMQRHGGLIRLDDLAHIPRPIERRALFGRWQGAAVASMPPPGAGRMAIEMLHLHEQLPAKFRNPDTPAGALALAQLIRRALEDRLDRPFDPNYFPQVKNEKMLSLDYAKRAMRRIRKKLEASGETTHLSVMDEKGNAIALTQSIERVYGSSCVTPTLGFLYNNYMSAFETEDPSHPYYLRPNGVPWASVAPTILFKGRRPRIAIGSPGSERIASAILQVLLRLGRSFPFEAVAAPRIHCSLDGKVSIEGEKRCAELKKMFVPAGFKVDPRERYSFYLGCVQMVVRDGERFLGVADPRRDGSAAGFRL